MNKLLPGILLLSFGLFSSSLIAAPGEWWEMSTKMEMEGMPFAMPAQSMKICMPKGGQSDPSNTQGKDKNCKMTDVKHSGNTVKFKGSCVDKGETMHIVGETSHDANSFKSNVKMTGKSGGENIDMKMASSGKRIGGACSAEEMKKELMAQHDDSIAKSCDTSKRKAADLIGSSILYIGPNALCKSQRESMCKVLRNDLPNDFDLFQQLERQEKSVKEADSLDKACKLNMESIRKSLCKQKVRSGPLKFLDASCPAEAKTYRELLRKRNEKHKDCIGRGFTSDDGSLQKCMGGDSMELDGETKPAKTRKGRADDNQDTSGSGANSSDAVQEGTKALKGMFGF